MSLEHVNVIADGYYVRLQVRGKEVVLTGGEAVRLAKVIENCGYKAIKKYEPIIIKRLNQSDLIKDEDDHEDNS